MTQQIHPQRSDIQVEKYYSIKEAANRFGIKYHHLLKAVRIGHVPSHRLMNSRRFVLLSEVRSAMSTVGGGAT